MMRYPDRFEAGRQLGEHLREYANRPDMLVLALPRGGVPVGFEIARELSLPLDVILVRKLGVPGHEELAMGALASGGVTVLNEAVVQGLHIPGHVIEEVARNEQQELARRERAYRGDRPPPGIAGKTIILVDDGLATGSTMRAAIAALRLQKPASIIVAVPVAAPQTCEELAGEVDRVVCALTPASFYAVGMWYDNFAPTTDEEVSDLLHRASNRATPIEHQSNSDARLSDQFDAYIHIDQTRALEPLDRASTWNKEETPETFPFGQ